VSQTRRYAESKNVTSLQRCADITSDTVFVPDVRQCHGADVRFIAAQNQAGGGVNKVFVFGKGSHGQTWPHIHVGPGVHVDLVSRRLDHAASPWHRLHVTYNEVDDEESLSEAVAKAAQKRSGSSSAGTKESKSKQRQRSE